MGKTQIGVSFRSVDEHAPSFEDTSPAPVIDGGGGVRSIRTQSKVLNKISATSPNLPAVSSLLLLRLLWNVNLSWCFDWSSMSIAEALRLQVELQKQLHEQLERHQFFSGIDWSARSNKILTSYQDWNLFPCTFF
ncbi:uncharacterized protein LOC112169089 isoform X2 [Rosa chinensis]|uniref:uncharacterized protein LOC112169089 isoform X2 n=1 Tax=Rosa chinensis TaxID=74649 RepID=UPI000D097E1B|nr:uncharacterized protein LOC112169089 isoform X2 [Rosa chinensis]